MKNDTFIRYYQLKAGPHQYFIQIVLDQPQNNIDLEYSQMIFSNLHRLLTVQKLLILQLPTNSMY